MSFVSHKVKDVLVAIAKGVLTKKEPDTKQESLTGFLHTFAAGVGRSLEIIYVPITEQLWFLLFEGEEPVAQFRYNAKNLNGRARAAHWLKAYKLKHKMLENGEKLVRHVKMHVKKSAQNKRKK